MSELISGKSTGWRTEALMVMVVVLVLALIGDLAGKYELPMLGEAAVAAGAIVAQVLSFVTARVRASK